MCIDGPVISYKQGTIPLFIGVKKTRTLPETNIAHENPHLSMAMLVCRSVHICKAI